MQRKPKHNGLLDNATAELNDSDAVLSRRALFGSGALTVLGILAKPTAFASAPILDTFDEVSAQAQKEMQAGNYQRSEILWRQANDLRPQTEYVVRWISHCLSRQRKFDQAIRIAEINHQTHRNDPNLAPWSLMGLCDVLADSGDYANAKLGLKYAANHNYLESEAKPFYDALLARLAPTTYELTFRIDPARLNGQNKSLANEDGSFYCPLPLQAAGIEKISYTLTGAKSYRELDIPNNSGKALRIYPDPINTQIQVTAIYNVAPNSFARKVRDFTRADIPADVQSYLKPTPDVQSDAPSVIKLAAELRRSDKIKTIEAVFEWSAQTIPLEPYQKSGSLSSGGGGALTVLKESSGHCEGRASLEIATLRALGIPARFIRGAAGIGGEQGDLSWHSWVEMYIPDAGWIPGDHLHPMFYAPEPACIGLYRYTSPGDAPCDTADDLIRKLWHFQDLICEIVPSVSVSNGQSVFNAGQFGVHYRRLKQDLSWLR